MVATGNGQTDQITANAGNDTLTAGTGAATFYSGDGSDVFVVNSTSDQVIADTDGLKFGADTVQSSVSYTLSSAVNTLLLTGSANLSGTGNNAGATYNGDLIVGNAGLDTLSAGAGTDTLMAGAGLATLVGAAGNDTFVINNVGDLVQDSLTGCNNSLVSSVSYTLPTNVNTFTLTGSANLTAVGNGGNDSIIGNSGADDLTAGAGNDTLVSGSGVDTLVGGAGADVFVINNSNDAVQSASTSTGNALFSSTSFVLPTNVNTLTLTGVANISGTGNSAADTLTGGAGTDTLIAGAGLATLIGGLGNTTFVVNSSNDVVQDSSATTSNTIQSLVNYTLVSNVNTLVLTGTAAITGTANGGIDTLTSNAGVDTLIGGSGNDTFVINNSADLVQDTSTTALNSAQSSVNYTLAANVNSLVLTGTSALTGTANSGVDTLVSNAGVDTLVGGAGNDTFIVSNALDVVQDTSSSTTNSIQSSVSYTLPTDVNALTLTGTAALSATGNTAANIITANTGNDTLTAGTGVATLIGGAGNDTFVLNSTGDVFEDSSASASNTVQSSVSVSLATNVNTLVLTGSSNLLGTANSANDTLTSNAGVDTLVGGSGNDVFVINNAADVLEGVTSGDTIESSVNYTLPASVNNLILIGSGNISGTGNANGDVIVAGSGTDTLADGSGPATLIGGSGNDTFVVSNASDVVEDSSATTTNTVLSSVNFTLPTNVDALTLTGSGNLTATGNTDAVNIITANAGADNIVASALSNTIYGGSGSDAIDAGPENNLVYAGNGGTTSYPTYVYGNASGTSVTTETTVYGGSGTDVLYGGPGSDVIYAGSGISSIYAGTGFDSLYGSAGDRVVDSLGGYDLLVAGAGSESLTGTGADTLMAGSGSDVLNNVAPTGSSLYEINAGFGQTTIGSGTASGQNLLFGTGIEPGSLTVNATQTGSFGNQQTDIGLVLRDGASSIVIPGALFAGTIGTVDFADTGPETLTQLINADGPGTVVFEALGYYIFSSGNGQSMSGANSIASIFAYGSNDTISSASDSTVVYAYGNADTISAPTYSLVNTYGNNDTITAQQVLAGGGGDFVTLANSGEATLVGSNSTVVGAGDNVLILEQTGDVVVESSGSVQNQVYSFVSYTLPSNVQILTLSSTANDLTGTSNAQGGILSAMGSFDTLIGGAGADTLDADGSNDVLVGGAGADTYVLLNSNDAIQFGTGNASLNSITAYFSYSLSSSANTLYEEANNAVATGNSANDLLVAEGTDTLVAGSGNDTLAGNGQATLIAGTGNDTFLLANAGNVILDSSTTSNDTVNSSVSFSLPNYVNTLNVTGSVQTGTGNSANDSLTASSYSDTLVAGAGNDTLVAGANPIRNQAGGADDLVAGTGTDVLQDAGTTYANTFVFNAGFGHDQVVNAQNGDIIQFGAGIAESALTFTALPGTGGAAPSVVISGAGGAVTLQGGLSPGAIADIQFSGGSSYTLQQLLDPSGRVTVAGANGNLILTANNGDSLTGGTGHDTVIAWGNNDTLHAGTGGTQIYAVGSNDEVIGGAGTDSLIADGANTTLVGGSGTESLIVNNASTIVQVTAGVGHDSVFSSVSYTVPTNVSVLTLTGTGSLGASANNGNDLITGNAGTDIFNDGGGADTFVGGTGNDLFNVNSASDVVQVTSPAGNDSIDSSVTYTLPANVNTLTLEGSGNINATGNNGNDILTSAFGNNMLTAGSGNDTLIGYYNGINALGQLTLVGGAGADSLFAGNSSGATIVTGSGVDTIVPGQYNIIVINNAADVLQWNDGGSTSLETIETSTSLTLPVLQGATGVNIDWSLTGSNSIYANASLNDGGFTISGNGGADTLTGASIGTSELIGGTGIDTLIGGGSGSTNTFVINNSSDVIVAHAGETDQVNATVSYTLPTNVTTLLLQSASLVGTGNASSDELESLYYSNDTLVAGTGADTLTSFETGTWEIAGAGADLLELWGGDTVEFNSGFGSSEAQGEGGLGAITVRFGAGISGSNLTASAIIDSSGNDALAISNGTGVVTLDGALSGQAYQFNFNGGSSLTLAQFLAQVNVTTSSLVGASGNLILEGNASTSVAGGSGNDTIYAAGAYDTVIGGSGNQVLDALGANESIVAGSASDTLTGLGANDTLVASSSVDTLIGGTGASVEFVVNATSAVIQLQSSPGADTVSASANYSLPANINTLMLTGTTQLKGSANSGTDTLISNTGLDTLVGSTGNDTFVVNNSSDVVTDTSTSASNTIQTAFSYSLPTDVNSLILTGTAALKGSANAGSDTLTSNSGLDTLVGSTGNDTFVINNSGDVVTDTSTSASNTILAAFSYSLPTDVNSLILTGTAALLGTANGGPDTLTSNTGIDTLAGGAGNDTFIINNASDVVVDTSTSTTNAVQSSVSFSLVTNVNSLTLTGTSALQGIANGGTDTLTSNSGTDTLIGGSGNDTFVINASGDLIQDTSTTAVNTAKSSVTYSLAANVNTLLLTGTSNIVGTANGGNDSLTANTGADSLIAGSGTDTLVAGTTGADSLVGGAGNDTFFVNNTADIVTDSSSSASNTLFSTVAFSLPTNVNALTFTGTAALKATANSGNDSLTANTGADTLVAGSGTDTLVSGSSGADSLVGGSGNATFVVNFSGDIVTDTSTSASNAIFSTVTYSLPTDVNTLTFTGTSALKGTANSGNDSLVANTGSDTLVGGSGVDTLVSGTAGTDSLVGGSGNDTFFVNFTGDIVTDTSTTANNTIDSSVTYSLPTNVNTLILTGTGALLATGNAHTDSITANSSADTLTAGSGVATLIGGAGNDTFVINSASDVVTDTSTSANNTILSTATYSLPTNVNTLLFTGTSALKATANSGNDSLTANTGADTLVAGSGTDTLVAGTTGTDSLVGGSGNDTFFVNFSGDIVTDTSTSASNKIFSTVAYSLPTDVNTLTFTGTSALKGTANSGNDSLTANTGADTLVAGSGTDTLVSGSSGADSLVGGTGNDTFFVNYAGDIVTDTSTTANNTVESSVTYSLPTDVNTLILTGTGALSGTGNAHTDSLTANSGTDTLTAGSGVATLFGGAGNDTFVINSTSDVVTDTSTSASNTISSIVTYSLPTNVNALIFTGTSALKGTANSGADSLTANTGADTLVAGSGTDTLVSGTTGADSMVGGSGNDTFLVNFSGDIVTDTSTSASNTILSTVTYSLPTDVNSLIFTGTSALHGSGNAGNDMLTANSGADTLTAGNGTDTLVSGSGIDSLVGGTGSDTFIVNNASDIVSVATSTGNDTIQSTANFTLPTNVQYLMLSGTAALAGTGNSLLDLIVGNTGADSLTGGTGIAALEGGKTAGSDQIKASGNQAALIAGGGSSTLTGGTYKDFYAAGLVSDSITTGATANVVSINKGDGATTLQPTTSATNVLSLGAGIDTESLLFSKSGNNLILTDGVSGDSITFTNWYVGASDQNYTTLQVVEIASANYNSGGSDGLRNEALEDFNFTSLVAAFNAAGSPANWALSTAMPSAQLASTSTAAYGGDLAYYFGLNGNLTGLDLSDVQTTLTNSSFATAAQTINSFSSISGGGGVHLLAIKPDAPIRQIGASVSERLGAIDAKRLTEQAVISSQGRTITPTRSPEIRPPEVTVATTVSPVTPRREIIHPTREPAPSISAATTVTAAAALAAIRRPQVRPSLTSVSSPTIYSNFVDPVNVAWSTMHKLLDDMNELSLGAEVPLDHATLEADALLTGAPSRPTHRPLVELGNNIKSGGTRIPGL